MKSFTRSAIVSCAALSVEVSAQCWVNSRTHFENLDARYAACEAVGGCGSTTLGSCFTKGTGETCMPQGPDGSIVPIRDLYCLVTSCADEGFDFIDSQTGQCTNDCGSDQYSSDGVQICPGGGGGSDGSNNGDGDDCPNEHQGNPVNVTTGNKFQKEVDYVGTGRPFALHVTRYYNSQSVFRYQAVQYTLFGDNWTSLFDVRLFLSSGNTQALLIHANGKAEKFTKQGANWASDNVVMGKLSDVPGGGYVYQSNDAMVFHFINTGKLDRITNGQGKEWQFSYLNGRLNKVTDSYGTELSFEYDAKRPKHVWKIRHPRLDLPGYTTVSVYGIYNGEFRSVRLHSAGYGGPSKSYKYTEVLGLTLLSESRYSPGGGQDYWSTWEYNAEGRVTHSHRHYYESRQSINKIIRTDTFDYTHIDDIIDSRVIYTNSLGKVTIYHLMKIREEQKIAYIEGQISTRCEASSQYIGYYSSGHVQTRTDAEGNVIWYERDNRGRVTKETRGMKWKGTTPLTSRYGLNVNTTDLEDTPSKVVSTTCWHSDISLPAKVISVDAVTTHTYNNGLLTNTKVEKRSAKNETCS